MLTCTNLTFAYQQQRILHNISLQFDKGTFIALLGKNGAGKSTLLRCLSGLERATAETLTVADINITTAHRSDIARQISFVPQEHEDMFPFKVLDVVVMGRTVFLGPFGSPTAKDYAMANDTLAELGITHLVDRTYTTLSGGEKQLVLLARALVQSRNMVFLDEPTNHLDYKNRYHMLAKLKKLSQQHNTSIVACLHDPNHALSFADEVVMLRDGAVIAHGPVKEVMTNDAISRLYDIPTSQSSYEGMTTLQPCLTHPGYRGKVLLLVGWSGEGKTTLLQHLIHTSEHNNFAGVLCPGTWKDNRRHTIDIIDIKQQQRCRFGTRATSEKESAPFVFSHEGKQLAQKALAASNHHNASCVIVDEVGPFELKGDGYSSYLSPLLSLDKPCHIWAVRPGVVEEVINRWMLVDPVVVHATDDDAATRINSFLASWRMTNG